jgi:two-component system, OmpR family, phosphate regulon sensor histidine kinase PhoR
MGALALVLIAAAVAGAGAASFFGPMYAAAGALLVVLIFLAIEYLRGRRLLLALRSDAVEALPVHAGGLWGEVGRAAQWLLQARQARLRETDARLQELLTALQHSPNGVVLLDQDARIEWCNETAAAHFHFDARRDLLRPIGNVVRDPPFTAYLASWNYSRDVVLTVRAEGTAPVKLSVQAHPYAGNRRLLLSRDVTAAEQAEATRRDFVANVSHEIRTPLTVLAGFVETLQTVPLEGDEKARALGMMSQQARRMQTLVNDLLTLSSLEGSPPLGPGEWIPVEALFRQCEQEARSLSELIAPQNPHQLIVSEPTGAEISGSFSELLSAMTNLAGNAVRYTPPGGRIEIGWRPLTDGRAQFWVRDCGPGIEPEHLPRLTERFYRVDRSRSRETGGTGLGLAIVKHVVQRHGAELTIESTPGIGSTFAVAFPASRVRFRAEDR